MSTNRIQVEYIWIDGTQPTAQLRSKTKIMDFEPGGQLNFPEWGFDGSSTNQADGGDSDRILKPVRVCVDPIRTNAGYTPNYLVLCEVFNPDGVVPHESNTRAALRAVLDAGGSAVEPWVGWEQEYTLTNQYGSLFAEGSRIGITSYPQGQYYCGVGAANVFGRELMERHTQACMDAGLKIEGTNIEVCASQLEFQVGAGDPLLIADHLWIARWLLHRISEDVGCVVVLDPKPAGSKNNGSGMHSNFSTESTRADPADITSGVIGKRGMEAITELCEKFRSRVPEHIAVYGAGNEARLTGQHETCSINEFRFGVADRGGSIRIPRHVANKGYGYFEDRRPAANADPYQVATVILKTICDLW